MFRLLLVLAVVLVAGAATWLMQMRKANRRIQEEIQRLFDEAAPPQNRIVTEAMLEGLPGPVQRYLTYSGVVGKPIPATVRLKQKGRIRQDADSPWMDFEAEEYYSVNPPSLLWVATFRKAGLPVVRGTDSYRGGQGRMLIQAADTFSIQDETGPEMNQGSMMRYLNEVTWFPAAFLGENMRFEPVDDHAATVVFNDRGAEIRATMYFDDEGRFVNFVAPRYRKVKDGYDRETWSTPISDYADFAGLKLPVRGQGVWNLASGDLAYVDITLTDIEYDVREAY